MEMEELLRKIALFERLSPENLESLTDVCIRKNLSKRDILFLEGQQGDSLFILLQGNVQLYKSDADGKEIVIKIVKPGEMFAEAILFEIDRYPVTAEALSKCDLLAIPRRQFLRLLEDHRFRDEFIGSLMGKLRYLAEQIRYLSLHDVEERFLIFLREQFGEREEIRIGLTKKDVASAIGTTPETLSRILLRLKEAGRLTWRGSTLRVDPATWGELDSQG